MLFTLRETQSGRGRKNRGGVGVGVGVAKSMMDKLIDLREKSPGILTRRTKMTPRILQREDFEPLIHRGVRQTEERN